VLDAGVLFVRVLLRVLVGGVGGDAVRNVFGDELVDAVRVGPLDVAELIVERLPRGGRAGVRAFGLRAGAEEDDEKFG
jgi:hypothetical protein